MMVKTLNTRKQGFHNDLLSDIPLSIKYNEKKEDVLH